MSIYAIADLHLSKGVDKPMDIFGGRWKNYMERIAENWIRTVGEQDTVVLPGDISWGMNDEETLPDLRFLEELPGQKILMRGNHDYWWQTTKKLNALFEENNLKSLSILYNNAVLCGETVLCGTKGYMNDGEQTKEQNEKLFEREAARMELSLKDAQQRFPGREKIAFLHYPPLTREFAYLQMLDLLFEYGVTRCYYGHLHGAGHTAAYIGDYYRMQFSMISADFVDFTPVFVK